MGGASGREVGPWFCSYWARAAAALCFFVNASLASNGFEDEALLRLRFLQYWLRAGPLLKKAAWACLRKYLLAINLLGDGGGLDGDGVGEQGGQCALQPGRDGFMVMVTAGVVLLLVVEGDARLRREATRARQPTLSLARSWSSCHE